MMEGHARKSLSASPRWSRCAGSIREEENYPDVSSLASIDGTKSHVLLELLLKDVINKENMTDYLGVTIGLKSKDSPKGWVVDSSRLNRVMVAVNYVQQRLDILGPDVMLVVEHRTNPGEKYGMDDMWGTVDITLIGGDSVLEVIDYKDGFVYVSEQTEQLLGYADGQIEYAKQHFFNIKTVTKTIIQPKASKNAIRSVTHTREQNDEMARKLANAAMLTDNPNAELTPGDHCVWCKHKPNCKGRNQLAINTIKGLVEPVKMSNKQLAEANDAIPMISSFIGSLKSEAEVRINKGQIVPGYEVAPGRKNRVWIDEDAADKKLQLMTISGKRLKWEDRFVKKLISPNAVLKLDLLKRQRFLIERLSVSENGTKKLRKIKTNQLTDEEMFSKEVERPLAPSKEVERPLAPSKEVERPLAPSKEVERPLASSKEVERPLASSKEVERPLASSKEVESERISKQLDVIFNPMEVVKKRVLVMTEKADGFTVAEFKDDSAEWTDELLVQEGYATWSKS